MRIALLGLSHESNHFAPGRTDIAQIRDAGILRGHEIIASHKEANSTVAGFLDAGRERGVHVVPLLYSFVTPSALMASEAFEEVAGEIISLLIERGPWDAVLMAQHGSAATERLASADSNLAQRVRAVVGPDVPIGLALDMHTNLPTSLLRAATVTVLYRTNPHVDPRERALECARLTISAARGRIRPVQVLMRIPLVPDVSRTGTGDDPMRSLYALLPAVERESGVLSASIAQGYAWGDVPTLGMSVLVTHESSSSIALGLARNVAESVWSARGAITRRVAVSPAEAFPLARGGPGPVLMLDVGDNIGGGGPGDSTVLLHAARDAQCPSLLAILFDPGGAARCHAAGVGATIGMAVGGQRSELCGPPLEVAAEVIALSDGVFEDLTPTHAGLRFFDCGPSAVIRTVEGWTLVLMSRLVMPVSIRQVTSLGIDPSAFGIIIAKGVISPRPAYDPVCPRAIEVASPGPTTSALDTLPYAHRRRPIYPLDSPQAGYRITAERI